MCRLVQTAQRHCAASGQVHVTITYNNSSNALPSWWAVDRLFDVQSKQSYGVLFVFVVFSTTNSRRRKSHQSAILSRKRTLERC